MHVCCKWEYIGPKNDDNELKNFLFCTVNSRLRVKNLGPDENRSDVDSTCTEVAAAAVWPVVVTASYASVPYCLVMQSETCTGWLWHGSHRTGRPGVKN